ncbi:LOC498308 [Phodopus roborovskii]|uniref:LOC498308 protein n=1 Tax=Phodopus roborovskii TaxID=109678 RepID=A0AAU9ZAF0_PHORO|nr:LOC498308 [Phodopus roborovskii]
MIFSQSHRKTLSMDKSSCFQGKEDPWSTDNSASQDKDELIEWIPSLNQQTLCMGQIPAPNLGSCSLGHIDFPFLRFRNIGFGELVPNRSKVTTRTRYLSLKFQYHMHSKQPCTIVPMHEILVEVKVKIAQGRHVGRTYVSMYKASHYSKPPDIE